MKCKNFSQKLKFKFKRITNKVHLKLIAAKLSHANKPGKKKVKLILPDKVQPAIAELSTT